MVKTTTTEKLMQNCYGLVIKNGGLDKVEEKGLWETIALDLGRWGDGIDEVRTKYINWNRICIGKEVRSMEEFIKAVQKFAENEDPFRDAAIKMKISTTQKNIRALKKLLPDWVNIEGKAPMYEIEKIVDSRKGKGGTMLLVKWVGYDKSENTWEPRSNLIKTAPDAIVEFEEHEKKAAKKARPAKKAKSTKKKEGYESDTISEGSVQMESVVEVPAPQIYAKKLAKQGSQLSWTISRIVDGQEITYQVDNASMRRDYPQSALDYYEQHLKFT